MTQGNIPNQRKSRSRSRSRSRGKTKSRSRSTPRTASDGGHGLWADKARVSASVTGESQGKQNGKKLTWSETEADSDGHTPVQFFRRRRLRTNVQEYSTELGCPVVKRQQQAKG
ncbi:hypothetical protein HPB50_012327 [Hyalomma asiaticum]|uniref:Uncharacterized protein n=1 Tax=Hyalomma asiaticum TaxID=266040 RepID=A0ACB7TGE1_HYAAI|nr:hypothetical protein HPB50_012327 [Hyalomma asiaticum]